MTPKGVSRVYSSVDGEEEIEKEIALVKQKRQQLKVFRRFTVIPYIYLMYSLSALRSFQIRLVRSSSPISS